MKKMSLLFLIGLMASSASVAALEVTCENVAGTCKVSESMTECYCENGTASGSTSGSGGAIDGSEEPVPTKAELEALCEEELSQMCGDEAPIIEDHCTEAQADKCTLFYEKVAAYEENCDDGDDDGISTSEIKDEVEPAEAGQDDAAENDHNAADDFKMPWSPIPQQGGFKINDWMITECCDELDIYEEDYAAFLDCVIALEDGDCLGIDACEGEMGGVIGKDEDGSSESSSYDNDERADTAGAEDDQGSNAGQSGSDGDSEEGDDAETAQADDETSNCRLAPISNNRALSLLSILSALF